jgi:hypothetical protein
MPHAADAQAVTAGGTLTGRIGYGDNPNIGLNSPGNSGVVGGTLTGWVQDRTETSSTRLTGMADLTQNFHYYGRFENYLATLEHQQTLSERLSGSVRLRYQDSINLTSLSGLDTNTLDLLSVGQRTRTFAASGTLQWTPSARDNFYVSPDYTRSTYPGSLARNYTQYGVGGGYLRQVTAKMKVGVDLHAMAVRSTGFPHTGSYQASVRLTYDFSPIWKFDGNVGLIRQVGQLGGSVSTPGFSATICGTYPRYSICFNASRQSSSSGFGGLRTDNRAGVDASYKLSQRSNLNFSAIYDISKSPTVSLIPTQKFFEFSGGYSRTITDRLSAGFSGRYQYRDYGDIVGLVGVTDTSVTGYSVTLDVTYKFGRIE